MYCNSLNCRANEEKYLLKVKELEAQLMNVKNENTQIKKQAESYQKQLNFANLEIESLNSQNAVLSKQYQGLLDENEDIKNELFDNRQQIISYQQQETSLKLSLEKYTRELTQMQAMMNRSDKSYQVLNLSRMKSHIIHSSC